MLIRLMGLRRVCENGGEGFHDNVFVGSFVVGGECCHWFGSCSHCIRFVWRNLADWLLAVLSCKAGNQTGVGSSWDRIAIRHLGSTRG